MAAAPRELVSDVISEILLHLPPDEPEHLFRASLVCKPWLRTISDPAFLRRYRALHGTPPLLGLIDTDPKANRGWCFRLIPTNNRAVPAFPLPAPDTRRGLPLDCRNGRVLVSMVEDGRVYYLVCDLEIGTWSAPATLEGVPEHPVYGRGALIGDEIYFMRLGNTGIIEYEWRKNCLSLVNPPPSVVYKGQVTLMVMEDCSLGLADIKHSSLYLWSRMVSSERTTEWVQCRVIDLGTVLPKAKSSHQASVVGFAEGVAVWVSSSSAHVLGYS